MPRNLLNCAIQQSHELLWNLLLSRDILVRMKDSVGRGGLNENGLFEIIRGLCAILRLYTTAIDAYVCYIICLPSAKINSDV